MYRRNYYYYFIITKGSREPKKCAASLIVFAPPNVLSYKQTYRNVGNRIYYANPTYDELQKIRLQYHEIDDKSFNERYKLCGPSIRLLFSFDDNNVKEIIESSFTQVSNIEEFPLIMRGDIGSEKSGGFVIYFIV